MSGLAALVLLVLVRAYLVQVTDPYLMSTGLNGHFEPCSSWQEYVSKKREQLIQARTKAGEDTSDAVIDFVAPFEIRSPSPVVGSKGLYKTGILLIHGLNLAPGSFRDMLPVYQAAGFLIRAVTLPGHGSCPGDLLDVDAEDYIACVKWAMETFRDEVDELYIAGMSTGGGLTLLLASANDPLVKGIILDSPLVEIQSAGARYASYAEKISWLDPRLKWPEVRSQRVPQLYAATSMHAVAEVYKIARKVDEAIKTPFAGTICSVTATDDETVNPFELFSYLFKRNNPKDVHLIYSLQPLEVPKTDALIETVWGRTSDFGADVISYNHIALLTSPSNPLFGRGFRYCGHYAKDDPLRAQCLDPNVPVHFGAITKENLSKYQPLARLYYNPGFSKAVAMIGQYLNGQGSLTKGQVIAIEQLIAVHEGHLRELLQAEKWADLDKAILTFQKKSDLGSVTELNLQAPESCENALTDINALKNLPTLVSLDLSGNKALVDYSVLKALPSLGKLNLSNTGFSDLSMLPENIIVLDLSDTAVTDLSGLSKLKKLTWLRMCNTKVSSLAAFKDMPSLRILETSTEEAFTSFDSLKGLVNCRKLELEAGKQEEAFPLDVLDQLPKIVTFRLKNIPVAGFTTQASNLRVLGVVGANLTAEDLSRFPLSMLITRMDFSQNHISEFPRDVKALYWDLEALNLSYNPIKDLECFQNTRLTSLDVSHTLVSDAAQVENLSSIVHIKLEGTPLARSGYDRPMSAEQKQNLANQLVCLLAIEQDSNLDSDLEKLADDLKKAGSSPDDVTQISVSSNAGLLAFPNLEALVIKNSFNKPWIEVGQLSKLRRLVFEGVVTDITLPASLEEICLDDVDLVSVAALAHCKNLKTAVLSNNRRLTSLASLASCSELESLDCFNCPIFDFSLCRNFNKLTRLCLSTEHAQSLDFLKDCAQLTKLEIATEDFAVLSPLSNLEILTLHSSTLQDLDWLTNENLQGLSVGGPDQAEPVLLDATPLTKFPNLRGVRLLNYKLTNAEELWMRGVRIEYQ